MIWGAITAIILGLGAHAIASAFSDEAEIIRLTALYFWIIPFAYGLAGIAQIVGSAFNAMGKPKIALAMVFIRSVAYIPAAWLGAEIYGIIGIFIATAAIHVITGIGFFWWTWRDCQGDGCKDSKKPSIA